MMTLVADKLKGFKHLAPGSELAVRTCERFGKNVEYAITVVESVDLFGGVIVVRWAGGTAFDIDGRCISWHSDDPPARLVLVNNEIRRSIWRRKAHTRIQTLLYNWSNVDDSVIESLLDVLEGEKAS